MHVRHHADRVRTEERSSRPARHHRARGGYSQARTFAGGRRIPCLLARSFAAFRRRLDAASGRADVLRRGLFVVPRRECRDAQLAEQDRGRNVMSSSNCTEIAGLLALLAVALTAPTSAAETYRKLSESEIRAKLTGMEISDPHFSEQYV